MMNTMNTVKVTTDLKVSEKMGLKWRDAPMVVAVESTVNEVTETLVDFLRDGEKLRR
jgi:hypothetical protein